MPRYFFHVTGGAASHSGGVREFPSDAAARAAALSWAGELLQRSPELLGEGNQL